MTSHRRSRSAFLLKLGLAALLVALADRLFFAHDPGATAGVFALAWVAGLLAVRPGLLKEPRAAFALAGAAMLALAMIDRPTLLGWLLFGGAVTVAAMSARVAPGEPVWRWAQRLVFQAVVGVAAPVLDLLRVRKARRGQAPTTGRLLRAAALPLLGARCSSACSPAPIPSSPTPCRPCGRPCFRRRSSGARSSGRWS